MTHLILTILERENLLYGSHKGRYPTIPSGGGRTRTCDLKVMGLVSYQLLHPAMCGKYPMLVVINVQAGEAHGLARGITRLTKTTKVLVSHPKHWFCLDTFGIIHDVFWYIFHGCEILPSITRLFFLVYRIILASGIYFSLFNDSLKRVLVRFELDKKERPSKFRGTFCITMPTGTLTRPT